MTTRDKGSSSSSDQRAASAGVPAPRRWLPICQICGQFDAACFGVYEDPIGKLMFTCGSCCGHGNEDGWCKPISEFQDWLDTLMKETNELHEKLAAVGVPAPQAPPDNRLQIAACLGELAGRMQGCFRFPVQHGGIDHVFADKVDEWADELLALAGELKKPALTGGAPAPHSPQQDQWNGDMQGSPTANMQDCGCVLGQHARRLFTCSTHRASSPSTPPPETDQ